MQLSLNDRVLSTFESVSDSDAFFSTRKSDGIPEKSRSVTVTATPVLSTSKSPTSRRPTEMDAARVPAVRDGQEFGSFTWPEALMKTWPPTTVAPLPTMSTGPVAMSG